METKAGKRAELGLHALIGGSLSRGILHILLCCPPRLL